MEINKETFGTIDIRWRVFDNTATIDEFNAYYLFNDLINKSVDKDILDYEAIIHKLLTYSYYEYEFMTVAIRYSFIMFELALKRYYLKLTGTEFNGSLSNLIKKYEQGKFITSENSSVLHLMRHIRNHFTHPTTYNVSPPSLIDLIRITISVINELEQIYRTNQVSSISNS